MPPGATTTPPSIDRGTGVVTLPYVGKCTAGRPAPTQGCDPPMVAVLYPDGTSKCPLRSFQPSDPRRALSPRCAGRIVMGDL